MKKFPGILGLLLLAGCTYDNVEDLYPAGQESITLQWNKAYADENVAKVETGMLWALSYLGAEWPSGAKAQAIQWQSSNRFTLNLAAAGFNEAALGKLKQLVKLLKSSGEYQHQQSIDLGRFLALTLGTTRHYYAITGVCSSADLFEQGITYHDTLAAITASSVSKANRSIYIPLGPVQDMHFMAYEGEGQLSAGTFVPKELEVLDMMPNGQLRFAMYDMQGHLKVSADTVYGLGGKPAKCLWCHESNFSESFTAASQDIPGYHSRLAFNQLIHERQLMLENYRSALNSDLDFTAKQDHTLAELLYISFMEPSAERLALEWNMPVAQVKDRLKTLSTHQHNEFTFLGALYHRSEVDAFAPFLPLAAPSFMREAGISEPNLLY